MVTGETHIPTQSTMPTPARRVLFAPTPEGTLNISVPVLRTRKRNLYTPHNSKNCVLKRGGFPLTPHEDEEEEGQEEQETPPVDGEEKKTC